MAKDDKERASCKKAGEIGHFQCGICKIHKVPRFKCGCLYIKDKRR